MWPQNDPYSRRFLAGERQRELLEAAHAAHRVGEPQIKYATVNERVRGFHVRLGHTLIVIGRRIYDEDRPCPDMA